MEIAMNETTEKKKGFWAAFYTFMAFGGIFVVLALGVVILILVSYLTK